MGSAFDEVGKLFLGVTAAEVHEKWVAKETDPAADQWIERVFKAPNFTKWSLRLMVKKDTFNDIERLKLNIQQATELGSDEGRKMLLDLHKNPEIKAEMDSHYNAKVARGRA